MNSLTLESFESFIAEDSNSALVSAGKYGIILVNADESITTLVISQDDFSKYGHVLKVEEHELNSSNQFWPWVSLLEE